MKATSSKVHVSERLGEISTLLIAPDDATHLLVLGHGAGAPMTHAFMQSLAEALALERLATLRYNFPYMEQGRKRPDFPAVAHKAIEAVVAAAQSTIDLPLILCGKSFGGRMSSQWVAARGSGSVQALVFYGFPLHSPAKPGVERGDHLFEITVPMLFLQGTRDNLAKLELLQPLLTKLPQATLEILEGANHSFAFPKKMGIDQAAAVGILAQKTSVFLDSLDE